MPKPIDTIAIAGKFTASKFAPPEIQAVSVRSDKVVATDRYKLIEIEHPEWFKPKVSNVEDFPDYEQIVPSGDAAASVVLNVQYLKEVADALNKLKVTEVTISIFEGYNPVVFEAQGVRAFVMPIKN